MERAPDSAKPPGDPAMVSEGCIWKIRFDYGDVDMFSREVAVFASVAEEEGNLTMTRAGHEDRHRVHTLGHSCFNDTGDRAVVEYHVLEPGRVQIQWAKLGTWVIDEIASSDRATVTHRIVYDMYYAVAEVHWQFSFSTSICGVTGLEHHVPIILSNGRGAFPANRNESFISYFLDTSSAWINAQVAARDTSVFDAVQAILRPIMFKWASPGTGEDVPGLECPDGRWTPDRRSIEKGDSVRILSTGEYPFGNEDDTSSRRSQ